MISRSSESILVDISIIPFVVHIYELMCAPLNGVHNRLNFYGKSLTSQRARAVPNQILKPIDTLYFYGKSLTSQKARAVPNQILKPIDTLYFISLNFLPVASTF